MPRTRENQVKFFLSDTEKKQLENKVKKSKLTKSDFLRKAVFEKEIIVIDNFQELFIEVKKQGTNLNQIAKKINSSEKVKSKDVAKLEEIKKEYVELNKTFREILKKL